MSDYWFKPKTYGFGATPVTSRRLTRTAALRRADECAHWPAAFIHEASIRQSGQTKNVKVWN